MSKEVLLALTVWALARDMMSMPLTRVIDLFMKDVRKSRRSADQFADIVIEDAMSDIRHGISYSKLNNNILNYKRL